MASCFKSRLYPLSLHFMIMTLLWHIVFKRQQDHIISFRAGAAFCRLCKKNPLDPHSQNESQALIKLLAYGNSSFSWLQNPLSIPAGPETLNQKTMFSSPGWPLERTRRRPFCAQRLHRMALAILWYLMMSMEALEYGWRQTTVFIKAQCRLPLLVDWWCSPLRLVCICFWSWSYRSCQNSFHSAPVSILLANISISVTRIFVYKLMPTVPPALAHKSFYRVVRDKTISCCMHEFILKSNHVRWGDVKYKPC